MTAMAFPMEVYKARLNAYIDGLIDGFKQSSPDGNYNPEFRKIAKNKLLKRHLKNQPVTNNSITKPQHY